MYFLRIRAKHKLLWKKRKRENFNLYTNYLIYSNIGFSKMPITHIPWLWDIKKISDCRFNSISLQLRKLRPRKIETSLRKNNSVRKARCYVWQALLLLYMLIQTKGSKRMKKN